jgi:tetratricopeptide (TPR) repeat protein
VPDQLGELTAALADRYRVERELGHGGMANVYLAEDLKLQRSVAIKVLKPDLQAVVGPGRFLREIQITARLAHPNILPLLDSGRAAGLLYYVMPYMAGESLRDRLAREKQLPIAEAIQLAGEVADALQSAHEQGVVHRDIKPGNILLEAGHAVVSDFGIAHAISEAGGETLTSSGIAVGTPGYMSPEQGSGEMSLDGRSDVYSLGCVLYEMLAGEPPFTGPSVQAIMSKQVLEPPPSIRVVRDTVSPALEAVTLKALAKLPADRFHDAGEFKQALDHALAHPEAGAPTPWWKKRALVAGLLVAVTAAAIIGPRIVGSLRAPLRLADNRVVVFPLATAAGGADAEERGWGAALAIEEALERTEPLKWLDGWQFLPADLRADPRRLTREVAVALTRAAGARYYIIGVIRGDTASPSVTLWLHDAASDTVVAPVTQAGIGTSVTLVAIGAVERLLGRLLEPGRKVDLTPLTQRAQGAIALTLQGDRAYRQARFLEALDLYKRAVAEDSLSALSAVKGAQAASWAARTEEEAGPLLKVALRADSLLPPKYRAFVRGLGAYFAGAADSATANLRRALASDPEWAEAWMALGEVYYHLFPRATRLDSLAEDAFRRATTADSLFSPPLVHLAEISARRGDLRATRQFVERFRHIGTDSTYARELRFLVGCLERGPDALSDAGLGDSVGVTLAAMHLAAGGARLDCAQAGYERMLAVAELPARHRTGLVLALSGVLMMRGRYRELATFLDSVVASGYRGALGLHLYNEALGAPPAQGGVEAERLARELAGELYEKAQPGNRWLLGLWQLRRGDLDRTAAVARSMDRAADSAGGVLERLFADALAAHVAVTAGDTAEALRRFDRLHADLPERELVWTPANTLAPTRLLQAEVLLQLDRYVEADSVAGMLEHPTILAQVAALPNALSVRAKIAAAAGRSRAAAEFRDRLARLRAN